MYTEVENFTSTKAKLEELGFKVGQTVALPCTHAGTFSSAAHCRLEVQQAVVAEHVPMSLAAEPPRHVYQGPMTKTPASHQP